LSPVPDLMAVIKTSRVHGTIERTAGMHGVRSAAEMTRIRYLPLAAGRFWRPLGQCRKYVLDGLHYRWSRKLETAFHSPATTVWPPLRGQCSWPVPSFPRRNSSASPFGSKLSARFGFEADTGRIRHSEPVARDLIRRSCDDIQPPLPFGLFAPSGSKRSTGLIA
jgi:hypothetical protein